MWTFPATLLIPRKKETNGCFNQKLTNGHTIRKHKGFRINSLGADRGVLRKNVKAACYKVNTHAPVGCSLTQYFPLTSTNCGR